MSALAGKLPADEVDSDEEEVAQEEVVEKEPEVPEDTTLTNPDVVTKYQEAAKITNAVLLEVIKLCVAGARIHDICKYGDEEIEKRTSVIFKNKNKAGKVVLKGVAFPVCISVNEMVCHVSPLESDDFYPVLADGDVVKIDLGVHIDGYIALVAHTIIVGMPLDVNTGGLLTGAGSAAVAPLNPSDRKAMVLSAAYIAAEVACKLIKPGNNNNMVTQAIKKVSAAFDVRPISGTLMHQMKQFVVDANKMILLREEQDQKVDACTFEAAEVYAIDIAMSTGEGKPKESGQRTTVHKRAVEQKYALKNKSSRAFFNEVNKKYPTMPFSIRSFEDEKAAKLGVRECVIHQLLLPYPVLNEKRGDDVAHIKFTILLLPSGTLAITGLPPLTISGFVPPAPDAAGPKSSFGYALAQMYMNATPAEGQEPVKIPDDIMEILETPARPESKKKAKKAAAKKANK